MKVNCESRMLHLSRYRCVGGMVFRFPFSNRGLDRKFSTSKYQWFISYVMPMEHISKRPQLL